MALVRGILVETDEPTERYPPVPTTAPPPAADVPPPTGRPPSLEAIHAAIAQARRGILVETDEPTERYLPVPTTQSPSAADMPSPTGRPPSPEAFHAAIAQTSHAPRFYPDFSSDAGQMPRSFRGYNWDDDPFRRDSSDYTPTPGATQDFDGDDLVLESFVSAAE